MAATKVYSAKQEKLVASTMGPDWSVVTGSGAAPCVPGDVIGPDWLVECKTHTEYTDKILFKADHWKKIKSEATVKHRCPALVTDNGTQKLDHTWIIVKERNIDNLQVINIEPLTYKGTTNINISESDLKLQFKSMNQPCDVPLRGLRARIDDDVVVIMSLRDFAQLVGD